MLRDSWFGQLSLWIQEDVTLSINQMNDIEASVMENPIKRLVEISFCGNVSGSGQMGARMGMGMGRGGSMSPMSQVNAGRFESLHVTVAGA